MLSILDTAHSYEQIPMLPKPTSGEGEVPTTCHLPGKSPKMEFSGKEMNNFSFFKDFIYLFLD